MASTYTGLGTELMTTGENAGTWGATTNTNLKIIEQLAGGYIEQSVTSTPTTLSVSDGAVDAELAHRIIKFTGTISADTVVTVPLDVQQMYILMNGTSGNYLVTFKYVTGSGSTVVFKGTDKGTKLVYATADHATNPNMVDTGIASHQVHNTLTVGIDGTGYDVKFFGDTAGSYALWDESADSLLLTDSTPLKIGDSQDLTLYHDGTNSYITNAVGALKVATETSGIALTIGHTTSETTVADNLSVTGNVTVGVDDTGGDVKLFGASAGAYALWDESANLLDLRGATAAGPGYLKLTTGELTVVDADILGRIDFQAPLESDGSDAILVGASIYAEADATFSATVNNTDIVFATGKTATAAERFRFTADNEIGIAGANYGTDGQVLTSGGAGAAVAWEDAGGGTITALNNATQSELVTVGSTTTELDAEANLTFTGSALTCIGTITVGVNDAGHDVKYFGNTASAYILWDTSADKLLTAGGAVIDIVKDKLLIGGTAVTTTAAELNLLDGLDATYLAVPGKLAGTDFTNSLLVGHSTTGTLDAATYNTGVGLAALDAITAGDNNVAVGYNAATALTTGTLNTFVGTGAGAGATDMSGSIGIGAHALGTADPGNNNIAIGESAGKLITGARNLCIGENAGDNITSGSGNVIIGSAVDPSSATGSRQLLLAGNDGSTTTTWIDGDSSGNIVVAGTTHAAGGQLTTTGKALVMGF